MMQRPGKNLGIDRPRLSPGALPTPGPERCPEVDKERIVLDRAAVRTRHLGSRWTSARSPARSPWTTHRFPHMTAPIILASGSEIRRRLLENAGVPVEVVVPRVDEQSVTEALISEGAPPRDVADALADLKARRVAERRPEALVIGCDQVLDIDGRLLSKPATPEEARAQLAALNGRTHRLLSAAVVFEDGSPVWRHVGEARLTMRACSDAYLDDYLSRNWDSIRHGGRCLQARGGGRAAVRAYRGRLLHRSRATAAGALVLADAQRAGYAG
jgi:septum formation protein